MSLHLRSTALLALLASCSSGTGPESSAAAPVRLFDQPGAIELDAVATDEPSDTSGLERLATADSPTWRALPWQGLPVQMDQTAKGAQRSAHALSLGPEPSSWLGLFEVPPDTPLVFETELSGTGLARPGHSAKLGALEFAARPTDEQLAMFPQHIIAGHFSDGVHSDAPALQQLFLHTGSQTHFVALLALVNIDENLVDPGIDDGDLRAHFEAPRLRPATQTDRLARLFDDDTPAGRMTDTMVAMTHRRSLALASGESLRIALDGLAPGDQIDLSLALFPRDDDPLVPALGSRVQVQIGIKPIDGSGPIRQLATQELETMSPTASRWHDLRLAVPTDFDTTPPSALLIDVSSSIPAREAPLTLVAEPRRVPAALTTAAPARTARRPNVIVISIDTLRADRMSLYGGPRPTTPAIDAFAERCLVFEEAWSNGAYTLPSHMSLFTGQVPSLHGVQGPESRPDPQRSPMLARILADRGYTTVAFTGGGFVDPDFGFGRGFDSYGTADPMVNTESSRLAKDLQKLSGIDMQLLHDSDIGHVNDWLDEHRHEEFLLFLHTYVAHQFDPPERSIEAVGLGDELAGGLATHTNALQLLFNMGAGGTTQDFADLLGLYDASVRQADEGVGRFLAKLEELDILEDSIVLIVSDHGKELGEHGKVGHGHTLYQEMVHVPILLFIGDRARVERGDFAPGRSATPASLVDVLPTLLEALDIAPTSDLSGNSLLHPLPNREVLAEVQNLAVKFALRRGDHKTIWSPLGLDTFIENEVETENFDLAADPLEKHPLPTTDAELTHLRAVFEAIEARSAELGSTAEGELDAGLRARLEALGYVEDMRQTDD